MNLAVIKTGGKQYLVKPGDKIKIEKIDKKEGEEIIFEEVLLVQKDGKDILIGTPTLNNFKVYGKVLQHGKGKKIIIFKYKPKKRYKKKQGHRQAFTLVEILKISS